MRGRSGRRRGVALAGVLLVLVTAAGCVRIPTSGPVQFATATPGSSQQLPVLVFPSGPRDGDSPTDIVRGFLDAMASYQPGYAVARQFLTPRASSNWDTSRVVVYDSSAENSATMAGGVVRVPTRKAGHLDARAIWHQAPADTPMTMRFPMAKVDGQWRISDGPQGVLMSSFDFQREYLAARLYFFDVDYDNLVADPRFLPVRGLEGALISRLAQGPSAWLAPVVRSAFPAGSRALPPTVRIVGDLAQVRISDERVQALSASQKRSLFAQVATTMAQVGVRRVQILVGASSTPLTSSSLPPSGIVTTDTFDGDLQLLPGTPGQLLAMVDGTVTPVQPADPLAMTDALAKVAGATCAVSVDSDRVAVVDETGTRVYLADASTQEPPAPVARGVALDQPSFDRFGDLWVADARAADARDRLRVVRPDGSMERLRLPRSLGGEVTGVRVGPDGIRLALIVHRAGVDRLAIARIERSGERMLSVAVSAPQVLPLPLTSISAVGWQDSDQLVVLGASGEAPAQPFQVRVDGSGAEAIASAPPALSMAVMPNHQLVIGRSGDLLSSYDTTQGWLDLGQGAHPCYPG